MRARACSVPARVGGGGGSGGGGAGARAGGAAGAAAAGLPLSPLARQTRGRPADAVVRSSAEAMRRGCGDMGSSTLPELDPLAKTAMVCYPIANRGEPMSGHNRWSTIKHKKALADAKKSKGWTKLIKEITVAAR